MKDRFDLENEIHMFGLFADDIKTVSNFLMESKGVDDDVSDKVVNALNGISILLEMKTESLMDTMSQCFKLDQYKEDGVKTWTSEITSPIHHGDMSYDPDSSELSVEVPLTDADNRVTTKSTDRFHATMSSFGYQ